MDEFRVTFDWRFGHEEHPHFPRVDPKGWVVILAEDIKEAIRVADKLCAPYRHVGTPHDATALEWERFYPRGPFAWIAFGPQGATSNSVRVTVEDDYADLLVNASPVNKEVSKNAQRYALAKTVKCKTCSAEPGAMCVIVGGSGYRVGKRAQHPHTVRVLDAAKARETATVGA